MEQGSQSIAILTSLYHPEITQKLEQAALDEIEESRVFFRRVSVFKVPGAFELPSAIQWCFEKNYSGAIALAAVIRGETSHFERISSHVEKGFTNLQLTYQKPIGFGVLTTDTKEQALDRSGKNKKNKGKEAAKALLEMLELKKNIFS